MTSTNPEALSILSKISEVAQSYSKNVPGARESLIDLSDALKHALELPSEAIQRMGWAEVITALIIYFFILS